MPTLTENVNKAISEGISPEEIGNFLAKKKDFKGIPPEEITNFISVNTEPSESSRPTPNISLELNPQLPRPQPQVETVPDELSPVADTPIEGVEEPQPEIKAKVALPKEQKEFEGQVTQGNIDLKDRPILKNADGSVSTEKSFSVDVEGKEVLIPQIVNGKELSQEAAIEHFRDTGEHLGVFDSIENANAAAEQIHNRPQAKEPQELPEGTVIEKIQDALKNTAALGAGVVDFMATIISGNQAILSEFVDADFEKKTFEEGLQSMNEVIESFPKVSEIIAPFVQPKTQAGKNVIEGVNKAFEFVFKTIAEKAVEIIPDRFPNTKAVLATIIEGAMLVIVPKAIGKGKKLLKRNPDVSIKKIKTFIDDIGKRVVERNADLTPAEITKTQEIINRDFIDPEIALEKLDAPAKTIGEKLLEQKGEIELGPKLPKKKGSQAKIDAPQKKQTTLLQKDALGKSFNVKKKASVKQKIEVPEGLGSEEPNVTGIKIEAVTKERAKRGQEPIPDPGVISNKESLSIAKERIARDSTYTDRLVSELLEKPRGIDSSEVMALDIRYVEMLKNQKRAQIEGISAFEKGDGKAAFEAKRNNDFFEAEIAKYEQMLRDTGTIGARGQQARVRLIREDYTLENLERRARAAKDFNPLTAEEKVEIKQLHGKIKAAEDAIAAKETTIQELRANLEINKVKASVRPGIKASPKVIQFAEKFVAKMEKAGNAAAIRAKEKLARLNVGLDPTLVADLAEVGAAKLARKSLDFAKFSTEMIGEFGQKIKPALKDIWDASKKLLNARLKPFPEKIKKAIKRKVTTQEKITNSKEKIKNVFEKSDTENLALPVRDLVRAIVETNPKITRKALIDQIHGILKEVAPGITRLETMDAISGRGVFTILAQDEISVKIRDLKTQIRLLGQQIDVRAGKPLPKTGLQRDVLSNAARQELQVLNELKRQLGVVVTNPEAQLAGVLQGRETYYNNRISDIKHEIATRSEIVKTKTTVPDTPKITKLKNELALLKQEKEAIFGKKKLTDKQKLDMSLKAAQTNLALWKEKLADAKKGRFKKQKPGERLTSKEIEVIRSRSESLREEVKLLKDIAEGKAKRSPQEIALQAAKTRTLNRITELNEKLITNDFSKRPRRKRVEDPELRRLRGDLEIVKEKVKAREEKFKWEQMGLFAKGKVIGADVFDASKLMLTTGELSFVLRQGKFVAVSRPLTTVKALGESLKSFASERNAKVSELRIREDAAFPDSQRAKLAISETTSKLTKQEDFLMSKIGDKIPVIKNFNRAARTFLNRIRYDTWLALRKSLSKGGFPTLQEDIQLAKLVNELTGRGSLGIIERSETATIAAGRLFFAPRYVSSRIQLATGHSMWGGTKRSRILIAREYARTLVGLGIYYNLLNFGLQSLLEFSGDDREVKIEFDTTSSDFGKVQVGKTRLDPLAGLAQLTTFAGRSAFGEFTSTSGKTRVIRGEIPYGSPTWWDIAARFVVSKANPVPAQIGKFFAGADIFGNETGTLLTEAGKLMVPITHKDIYDVMIMDGVPTNVALSLLTFMGEGLQTFEKRKQKPTTLRRKSKFKFRKQSSGIVLPGEPFKVTVNAIRAKTGKKVKIKVEAKEALADAKADVEKFKSFLKELE